MERLKFYNIDDEYIKYLYQFDNKVPFNKNNKRPYIGIILEINNMTYFAPMFSPKLQHNKYKSNSTYIKIGENLGLIRLNNMIPVCKKNLRYIDFNKIQDQKYRNLLIQQNNFIQLHTEKIRNTANKLYQFVTKDKKEFFIKICCDFKLLESKCKLYNNIEENENIKINNNKFNCEEFEKIDIIKPKFETKYEFFIAGRARNKENILKICDLFDKYNISYYCFLKNEENWGYGNKNQTPEEKQKEFESLNLKSDIVINLFNNDLEGERSSKNLLLVLPAGKAAHIESGIAYGMGKKCYAIGEYEATDTLYNIFEEIFNDEKELEEFLKKYFTEK